MASDIITYKEVDVHPIQTITWNNVLSILKAAHNVRFCGSEANAISEIEKGSGAFTGDSVTLPAAFPFVFGGFTSNFKLEDPYKKKFEKVLPLKGCHYTTYYTLDDYIEHMAADKWTAFAAQLAKTTGALSPEQHQEIASELANRLLEFFDNALAFNKNPNAMVLVKPVLINAMHRADINDVAYGHLGKTGSKHSEASWYSKQVFLVGGHGMDTAVRQQQNGRCLAALLLMAEHIAGQH